MSKSSTVHFPEGFLLSLKESKGLSSAQKVLDHLVKNYIADPLADPFAEYDGLIAEQINAGCSEQEMKQRIVSPMKTTENELEDPEGGPDDLKGLFEPSITVEDMEALHQEIIDLRAQNANLLELLEKGSRHILGNFKTESLQDDQEFPNKSSIVERLTTFSQLDAAIIGAGSLADMDIVIEAIQGAEAINPSQQTGLLMRAKGRRALLITKGIKSF